jgi:hypothetical protein
VGGTILSLRAAASIERNRGTVEQQTIFVNVRDSMITKMGGIIVSAAQINYSDARLVVGRPGLPNLSSELTVGGAVLFETPEGLFEIRVLSISMSPETKVKLLISQVSPRPGIAAGLVDYDADNLPFTDAERLQISISLKEVKQVMSGRSDVTPEQFNFLVRKLNDIEKASERLGRKDWVNYALGTLTSIIVAAAFTPEGSKAIVQAMNIALGWLFSGTAKLLPLPY